MMETALEAVWTFVVSWQTLVVLALLGIAPGACTRLIVLAYPRGDKRRDELVAEIYEVPALLRPLWVAQHLEIALSEGLPARWRASGRRRPARRLRRAVIPAAVLLGGSAALFLVGFALVRGGWAGQVVRASPVVGAAITTIILVFVLKERPRRALTFAATTNAILSGPGVQVSVGDRILLNPHILVFTMSNTGNVGIRSADFDAPIMVHIPGVQLIQWTITTDVHGLNVTLHESPTGGLTIAPLLLNPGDGFAIHAVLEGTPPHHLTVDLRPAGTKVIDRTAEFGQRRSTRWATSPAVPGLGLAVRPEAS